MKNMLEGTAITAVIVLFLFIIALIVQYNMINDGSAADDMIEVVPSVKKESKKAKTSNYLENLETYTDVDVKVDPTKVNNANRVQVRPELAKDAIGSAVENTDKSHYVDSLKDYADEKTIDQKDKVKTAEEIKEETAEDDKVKLDQEEIVDEIGNAIGAALEDI